uniref:CSON007790 protein n=1 Tax=Culicoides sonorensis TaxID=179676 RepID=A0A336LBX9_CULSO
MKTEFFAVFLFLMLINVINLVHGLDNRLPPSMKLCRRSLPTRDRNECIKDSINHFISIIGHGYPSLNLPDLDPYVIGEERFSVSEGIISMKLKIKNSLSKGVSKGQVRNVKSKITKDNFGVILDVAFPFLGGEGNYKGETRLNQIKVQSKGYFKLDVFKPSFKLKILGKIIKRNETEYVDIHTAKISDVSIDNLKVDINGLLPEPELDQFAVEFVNQNWRALYEQLVPRASGAWEPIYFNVTKTIFDQIPLNELMPE